MTSDETILDSVALNSLDLKCALVGAGVHHPQEVHDAVAAWVWMPTPGSSLADSKPPGLGYYRQARREFARLYKTYGLNPPGAPAGSHVSLCRDIYRNIEAILA